MIQMSWFQGFDWWDTFPSWSTFSFSKIHWRFSS